MTMISAWMNGPQRIWLEIDQGLVRSIATYVHVFVIKIACVLQMVEVASYAKQHLPPIGLNQDPK